VARLVRDFHFADANRSAVTSSEADRSTTLRVGIVGCGAAAERLHIPAVLSSSAVRLEALVDTTPQRAQMLADEFRAPHAFTNLASLAGHIDVAILALPNAFHLEATEILARMGVHVLVEKPMARSIAECQAMNQIAAASGIQLGVAHVRRYFPSCRLVGHVVRSGMLGHLRRIDIEEGAPYRWPVMSSLPFDRSAAGGGVLIDVGTHVFDLLRWWFGEWEVTSYEDDNLGGVEADCVARLRSTSGVVARVELSRTRSLRNNLLLDGDRVSLSVGLDFEGAVELLIDGARVSIAGTARSHQPQRPLVRGAWNMVSAFVDQIDEFAAAVQGRGTVAVSGIEGMAAVGLVEVCYAARSGALDPFPIPAEPPEEVAR
jgi:predicted dehydrogenase